MTVASGIVPSISCFGPDHDQRRDAVDVDALGDPRVVGDVLGLGDEDRDVRCDCAAASTIRSSSRSSIRLRVDDQEHDDLAVVVGAHDARRAGRGRP